MIAAIFSGIKSRAEWGTWPFADTKAQAAKSAQGVASAAPRSYAAERRREPLFMPS